jgi:hypothetical protein
MQMVSYPYYAKYQHPATSGLEDNMSAAGFQHIDLNPGHMAEDPNRSQIQGSVSFDDEGEDDCTKVVMGMHKQEKLEQWVTRMRDRGVLNDKLLIMAINDKNLNSEDLKSLGLRWEPQPCPALGARLTYPHLPHGAYPAKRIRRTVLPWFCGLHGDHLDHEGAGTWEELSKAHRDLMPGPSSPSSYTNKYGLINYPFPAAVRLSGNSAISDAMVAQVRWASAEVQHEIKAIKDLSDAKAYGRHLDAYRKKATANFRSAFAKTKALELTRFPTNGFYVNGGDWDQLAPPDAVPYEEAHDDATAAQKDTEAATGLGHYDRPTLVFHSGTCRVPTLHPPTPKVPVWNVSRSKIAPCGSKVAAPGTRRECRPIPTPWNPSRTLNRGLPPASKLPSWNVSRL